MCARATLSVPGDDLAEAFGLLEAPSIPPRWNIAPTQPILVQRRAHTLEFLRFGLTIERAKGTQGINVRAESVARAPGYREAFRTRRCLVVVDGFYEWERIGKVRQPYLFRRADRKPFALAGIWNREVDRDGVVSEACAILTGAALEPVARLHERMPIIVPKGDYARWLDPQRDATDLLTPRNDDLVCHPVSTRVNSPANDDPACAEQTEPTQMGLSF